MSYFWKMCLWPQNKFRSQWPIFHVPVIFRLLFFALKNNLVLLAKLNSGELRCPATALILPGICWNEASSKTQKSRRKSKWVRHYFKQLPPEIQNFDNTDQLIFIPPGIYAEGYIVFLFPFVRLYVHSFVRSFVLPSCSWNYFKFLR